MAVRLEPSTPGDLDAIASLLTTAFNAPTDASFVDRRLLQWKYFEPYGAGSLPRSYVLKQDDDIVAHCVSAPLTMRVAAHECRAATSSPAVCFTDWAGGRRLPGAGIILMKKLMAQSPVAIVAGGSDATRQAIPRLGFTIRDSIDIYARVIRPLRQARTRPSAGLLKDAARLARNAAWSRAPVGDVASGWSARPVAAFQTVAAHDGSETAAEHAAEYLNYWLRCPAARMSGFELLQDGRVAGYFMLSRVGGQARVAALGLSSSTQDRLQDAFRLAVKAAADDPDTCEVVGLASTPGTRAALAACGFTQRDSAPLYLFDRNGIVAANTPILWSAIDDDTAYVHDPASPYRT